MFNAGRGGAALGHILRTTNMSLDSLYVNVSFVDILTVCNGCSPQDVCM